MRAIQSIGDLNIPHKYRRYILRYLQNISAVPFINRVILFGSCAKEAVTQRSDIDILIIVNREITEDEEIFLMYDCLPTYSLNSLSMDIIVQPEDVYNTHTDSYGMVQKQVNKYGVDLSGLLHQRMGL